jgi:tripartite-type tricarboxylate transporter receptor subunit TctC
MKRSAARIHGDAIERAGVAALALALACLCSSASAQEWPQRPPRLLVPFAAGGNTDSIARLSAEWLGNRIGQTVVVENRPGASGSIATEAVARAQPDGYTLLIGTPTQLAILPAMTKVPYDAVRDFSPLSIVGVNPYALGVHPSLPVKTLKDLVALAKARPGEVTYGSAGSGAGTHLTMALFLSRAGVQMNHIPYKGGSVAVAELIGGQVATYFGNLAEIVPQARGGRVRALAVSSLKRTTQLPDVPTVSEQGYPGFEAFTWNGLLAPAKTPAAIVDKLARELAAAAKDAGIIKRLDAIGVEPLGNTPAEFAKVLAESITLYTQAVKISGAKVE